MFGVLLPYLLLHEINIMFLFWMFIVAIHGFFPWLSKVMYVPFFFLFKKNVKEYFNCKIKLVQSNWGGEYCSLSKLLQNMGITHRLSCPHTHQQNGTVERKHRHIVETGLALMSHTHVPLHFWDDAFQTACYLINCLPTPILKNASPIETLFCTSDYSVLRIFGCTYWPNLRLHVSHKLPLRSTQCVFMEYSLRHKGYKCTSSSFFLPNIHFT
jgi:hypothetical protein